VREVDFPGFVRDLVHVDAIVDASIRQMEAYARATRSARGANHSGCGD
jgi:hypothetical protein